MAVYQWSSVAGLIFIKHVKRLLCFCVLCSLSLFLSLSLSLSLNLKELKNVQKLVIHCSLEPMDIIYIWQEKPHCMPSMCTLIFK